jgi:hypothetical protein
VISQTELAEGAAKIGCDLSEDDITAIMSCATDGAIDVHKFRELAHTVAEVQTLRLSLLQPEPEPEPPSLKPASKPILEQVRQVANEILSTEINYCRDLNMCIEHYFKPLRALAYTKEKPMEPHEVALVFSNIEDIHLVRPRVRTRAPSCARNKVAPSYSFTNMWAERVMLYQIASELRCQLTRRLVDEGSCVVADIFNNMGFAFKLYARYVANFSAATDCLHKASQSKRFVKFHQEAEAACKDATGNQAGFCGGLRDMLIKPVQRIPRYELLLREIRKTYEKNGGVPDTELERAIGFVHDVASHNNEVIKDDESREMLYGIQQKLKSSIVTPYRRLVREGLVQKVCRTGYKPYRFILLNDVLLTVTETTETDLDLKTLSRTSEMKYKLHHEISLSESTTSFQLRADDHLGESALFIESSVKTFIAHCHLGDSEEWLADLIQTQRSRRKEEPQTEEANRPRGSSATFARPMWTENAKEDKCMVCKTAFTWINRKHHCRICGMLVCNDCSPHRVMRDEKPERVCSCCESLKTADGSYHVAAGAAKKMSRAAVTALQHKKPRIVGYLEKKGGRGKNGAQERAGFFGRRNWKRRWFVLRSTVLQYYEDAEVRRPGGCNHLRLL